MTAISSKTIQYVVLIVLLALSRGADAGEGCDSGRSEVSIEGPRPETDRLEERIPTDAGLRFERGSFDTERIQFVAHLADKFGGWQFLYIETT